MSSPGFPSPAALAGFSVTWMGVRSTQSARARTIGIPGRPKAPGSDPSHRHRAPLPHGARVVESGSHQPHSLDRAPGRAPRSAVERSAVPIPAPGHREARPAVKMYGAIQYASVGSAHPEPGIHQGVFHDRSRHRRSRPLSPRQAPRRTVHHPLDGGPGGSPEGPVRTQWRRRQ